MAPTAPTDADATTQSVLEGATNGTAVGITAASTDSNGPAVGYILTDDAGGRFAINSSTGVVTVANAALINYETATSHAITVQATDGFAGATTTFTIAVGNVNPTAPTDSNLAANSAIEGASLGTSVGITAASTDPSGGTIGYSLADSTGGRFTIDISSGVVTIANAALLTPGSYTITAGAGDSFGASSSRFTIVVLARPVVTGIAWNTTTGSDANVGPNGFTVTATYNVPVNTAVPPSIAFPAEVPAGSITFSSGDWLNSTTWRASFTVADLGTTLNNIDLQISSGEGNGVTPAVYTALDAFRLDTQNAIISSITSTTPNGSYTLGQTLNLTINFSEVVTLLGTMNLTLDTGAVVSIPAQSGTSLSGTYTVGSGQNSNDLNVVAIALASEASLRDAAGNASVLALPASNLAENTTLVVAGTGVTSFMVNDGEAQRSRLTKIVVNFSAAVDAASVATGITLTRAGGTAVNVANGLVNGLVVSPASGPVTSFMPSFANAINDGVEYGSLADGSWRLAIPSQNYTSSANDPQLRRLFGDVNADGTVDGGADFSAFGVAFGLSLADSPFDFNNDGTIEGGTDFAEFGRRFGLSL